MFTCIRRVVSNGAVCVCPLGSICLLEGVFCGIISEGSCVGVDTSMEIISDVVSDVL